MQYQSTTQAQSLHNINVSRNLFVQRKMALLYFEINDFHLFESFFGSAVTLQAMDKANTCLHKLCSGLLRGFSEIKALDNSSHIIIFETDQPDPQAVVNLLVKIRPQVREEVNKVFFPLTGQKADLKAGYSFITNNGSTFQESIYKAAMQARQSSACKLELNELPLLQELRNIIELPGIKALYQPIMDFRTNNIIGWEALARGPENSQFHTPLALFDFAEDTGMLFQLERTCREQAIKSIGPLGRDQKIFLNIHPQTLVDPNFKTGETMRLLEQNGLTPDNVVFEITERHSTRNFTLFFESLNHYRQQGYMVAVDDLGAGYNGLFSVAEIKPDFIKIDMSLTRGVDSNPAKRALVEAIITFAEKMDAKVIAEGIETRNQLEALVAMGAHSGQGFFLARPEFPKPAPSFNFKAYIPKETLSNAKFFGRMKIRELTETTVAVARETKISSIKSYFEDEGDDNDPISAIVVCDNEIPEGLIMSHHLDQQLSNFYGVALYYSRDVTNLMDSSPLIVDADELVEQVANMAVKRNKYKYFDNIIVTDQGRYLGTVSVQKMLDTLTKIQVEIAKGVNPLTGLPGNTYIESAVESRIGKNGRKISIIYADLDNFKAYNDVYGFKHGDQIIQFMAKVLTWATRRHGLGDDFIGHVGGDDFIIITSTDKADRICKAIVRCFQRLGKSFYSEEDRKRGYIQAKNRDGQDKNFPMISISLAIVDCFENMTLNQISKLAAGTKKLAKSRPGNVFVRNRRLPADDGCAILPKGAAIAV
ncbi:GGDEF domain-containing protein [Desulfonatronovibrio magnus]|uniref:GGDEF domain-containing protein n=1 Tax=Desulfonatronovibrio magnus TaxID=698827 RepID=UPI000697E46F|nr:bifunctional diguanylate cyclase/phosphodiesterase [Desulfonatronovibrio magnus]